MRHLPWAAFTAGGQTVGKSEIEIMWRNRLLAQQQPVPRRRWRDIHLTGCRTHATSALIGVVKLCDVHVATRSAHNGVQGVDHPPQRN
jgi:hypothetical protein